MKKCCLLLLLALPFLAQAQSKVNGPTAIWPELQLSYGLGEDGLLFFRNQYRLNTDGRYNDLQESGLLSGFERVELTLGYEHTLSEHWRGGAMFRYAAEDYPTASFYSLFLRHNGNIRSLFFNKQVLAEYVSQQDQEGQARFRLAAELGRRLPLRNRFITPSLEYEALLLAAFSEAEDAGSAQRTVDRIRLRLNLTYEVTEKLRLTPYFMRQTDYYYVLVPPVYNEQEQLVEEGYTTKRNRVSPVVGLEVKYTFNRSPDTASITY